MAPDDTPPAAPYFRMLVLDEYIEGGGFRVSASLRREYFGPERSQGSIEGQGHRERDRGKLWTIYLEPGIAKNLPLPSAFERVRFRDALVYRQASALHLVQLRDEPMSMVPYRIEGALDLARLEDVTFLSRLKQFPKEMRSRMSRRLCLELPADSTSREVLANVLEEARLSDSDPLVFADKATRWLRSRHSYALSSTLEPGKGDTVVRWMTGSQAGHCELFATSLVLLARSAGYPARVVVGFHGGTWNSFSNSLSIRNRDAHAWCEIWDGKGSWARFDPTPGATQAEGVTANMAALQATADKGWSARLDGLRVVWYRRIVNFDQQTQMDAVASAKNILAGIRAWFAEKAQALKDGTSSLMLQNRLVVWLALPALALIAAGLSWLVISYRRYWRWQRKGRSSGVALDPVRREAGRWLVRFRQAGLDDGVCRDLESLRFGSLDYWPAPAEVFALARKRLRERKNKKA